MEMKSDAPIDYALLQLTPKRSHCDFILSRNGEFEKIFSGLVNSFTPYLKGAEEKLWSSAHSIELRVDKRANGGCDWFTKGLLERFVRFVNAPDILEQINTYDVEMSQLEAALKIYSEGLGDQSKNAPGLDGAGAKTAADATKRELIRAIDVRLVAVKQDIASACFRAAAAGFDPDTVSDLQFFAHHFGSSRLKETCENLTTLWQRRPELVKQTWLKTKTVDDRAIRSSTCSDMSIEEDPTDTEHQNDNIPNPSSGSHRIVVKNQVTEQSVNNVSSTSSSSSSAGPALIQASQPSRRLSVQDRINLFENKQKETSVGKPASPGLEKTVLRRLSPDVSSSTDRAVLRRWSGVSDMSLSVDLSGDNKSSESSKFTPSSSQASVDKFPESIISESVDKKDRDSEEQMKSKKEQFERRRQESVQERPTVSSEDRRKTTFLDVKTEEETTKGMISGRDEGTRFESQIDVFQSNSKDSVALNVNSKSVVPRPEFIAEYPVASWKDIKREASPPRNASFSGQVEVFEKTVLVSTTKALGGVEDSNSDTRRIMFPDEGLTRDHTDRKHTRKTSMINKQVLEVQEGVGSSTSNSVNQVQRFRQSKGNQELNEELQLKANELEKLFAEHKLNVPGSDQSASARRNKPFETNTEHAANSRQKSIELPSAVVPKTSLSNESVGSSITLVKSNSGNLVPGKALKDPSEVTAPDSAKGMAYIRYMQKRDAKLRKEWDTNRTEKEAKMKAMLDNLERSSSEMKAKFSVSMDRNDSVSNARWNTDKFRSFNVRSSARREQPVDDFENEEMDEDDTREEKAYSSQKVSYEDSLPDSVSKNNQNKKLNRNISSTTPRTPSLPVSRSAVKANNLVSGKRKTQPENPLAQSVPNFAEFRNENAKPTGTSIAKTTPRPQPRNFARSRSSVEEVAAKDVKAKKSQSLRKSYANPAEFKDLSALNPEIEVLTSNKLSSKTFLRKGNGIGPGSGANLVKMKTSATSEVLKVEEESFEQVSENEEYRMIKEEEVEESDTETEECNNDDMDTEDTKLKNEIRNFSGPGSGNDESVSAAESRPTEPAIFQSVGSVQESPSESPLSWNARMNQSFSYPQESSDVEASVDSHMGSPASWNSHSMTQREAEAVRMRKKWGSAHKPFVASSSPGQSRSKDMTKGFKRLLKFGRKSRGTETLVDWISATTSEGDDDTEDGRDPASRSSDDLRKSRMGFTPSHPADDAYNESELYSDQVQSYQSIAASNFKFRDDHLSGSSLKAPRSFFSLSSFRSNKGSESKPR